MSTLGKVCLVITLLLLMLAMAPIPGKFGGWTPRLLLIHNQWSQKLRDSKQKAREAVISNREARQEFNKAMADVSGLTIGWDRFWNVPARSPQVAADTPTIAVQQGRLILNNIGVDNGLKDVQYTDDNGDPQIAKPIVHAFYGGAEGYTYAGEFRAQVITAKRTELQAVRRVTPQEVGQWNPNVAWRLRTMVPPGRRTTIDELFQQGQRINELSQQMAANIGRQNNLLAKAQEALQIREGELLGGNDREVVPMRPEFTEGLQKVNEDVEEERNQILLEIDRLRREIKVAYERRDRAVNSMNELMSRLPGGTGSQFADALNESNSAE